MSIINNFFDTLDFKNIRTSAEPKLIFLCGGTDTKDFRPHIYKELKVRNRKVIRAEDIMKWQVSQKFGKDLLELEKYIATIVSIIPIVCESPGSIAELGAFISDKEIRHKLYIIIEEKFYEGPESESFIRWGPIKNYEDNVPHEAYPFNDGNSQHDIAKICDELDRRHIQTSSCDLSNKYFHIFLLMDIINILSVASITEIKDALSYALVQAGQEPLDSKKHIEEMLVVLGALGLVKKRSTDRKKYFIVKGKEFYLSYSAQNSNQYKKITEVKKEAINEIYLNDKIRSFILRDERKKGDVEWLKKSDLSQLQIQDRQNILRKAPLLYKVYDIPKKSGGTRTIAQPTHELKLLQSEAFKNLEATLPIHPCAKAYKRYVNGILTNAEAHKDSKFFFKYDFKNFFPSIKAADFNKYLEKEGYSEPERIDLLKTIFRFKKEESKEKTLAVYRKLYDTEFNQNTNSELLKLMIEDYKDEFQLSIGAPSSPFVSNTIMFDFDKGMHNWAEENGFIYTRFADDITISCQTKKDTGTITAKLNETLKDLEYPTLRLNDSKQKSVSLKNRVTITGLNITSEHKVSLGRKKKKDISAMIHHYKDKRPLKYKMSELSGWLAYAYAVDNEFFKSMKTKYGEKCIASIMKKPK